ncbi:hypothetical protein K4039_12705 [Lyngbya sp. CCAP 1446/10]|uniref:hypothetical protein n=1 Tax=Lyngbya sp. CCAP 1446/10 TaxID=439293 RepID=UPI0022388F58|nr:hypothetical protein [Lyngbya sp. CCAP 1446/10]MCW6050923.1 hypothetical protein [Lyngbya sp. CCAP 1446/10]
MSATPEPTPESNILGNFASVVGLLGAALFFTGWIYRWSYFYFFQIQVTTLDLPVESFFMAPLQVFLADGPTIFRSAIAILLTALGIYLTLWLVNSINHKFATTINRRNRRWRFYARRRRLWLLLRFLKSWQRFNINRYNSIKLLRSLVDEIIIVSWVLLVLFWSAYHQGITDARHDASETSALPAVTLIAKEDNLALGRKLEHVFENPSAKDYKEYRIIGDKGLFDDLVDKTDTDATNSKEPRIWRLLLQRGNWIYLFPALTNEQQKDPDARPPVVAVQQSQSGDQLLILSPTPSQPPK